jgi:molecular chaperone DnaK (HSP70)
LKVAIDENGLIKIVGSDSQAQGFAPVNLVAQIHQHVNLVDEHIKVLAEAEVKMQEQDKTTEKVYELKNKLESQIYTTKEKIKTEFNAYLGPGELEKFEAALDEINNWIYNVDASVSHHTLLQKK